jgi:hypothetical protein
LTILLRGAKTTDETFRRGEADLAHPHAHCSIDRRAFLRGATGAAVVAGGVVGSLGFVGPLAGATTITGPAGRNKGLFGDDDEDDVIVLPKPILGGITLPDNSVIHVLAPGPTNITLPLSGSQLAGEDVDSSTITDFDGFSAVGFHVGTAQGSDGKTYNLETDMRGFQGRYLGTDGQIHNGSFIFV